MADYIYTRAVVDNAYNINNKARVDGGGEQIHLSKEVETALPGESFKLICDGTEAKFVFYNELSSEDQDVLSDTVTAHKDNT